VISGNLVDYFKIITDNYNDITLGLSGGLDSRLILALLLKNGIKPFVYTHGRPDSHEVNISRSICEAFNLEFRNYHEKEGEEPGREELNEIASEKFLVDDGFNMFGIFYSTKTKDIELSQIRELNFNGMGGEIYRTRWQLPDRNIDFDYFLKVRYLISFQDELVSARFNKKLFFKNFLGKIKNSISKEDSKITPPMTNLIYPQFKMRYWAGRTISKLNQFCYSLLPFGEPRLYLQSIWLPAKYKIAGRFEAGLIKHINPELARFRSNYLFNFYDGPGFRSKLMEWSKIYSPAFVKKTTPGFIRHIVRSKRSLIPDNLRITKERGESVFGRKELMMKDYINIDKIITQDMYSRILTLEYYFKNYLS
jgi:asparagine synthase (glutamine-hydrolysing)